MKMNTVKKTDLLLLLLFAMFVLPMSTEAKTFKVKVIYPGQLWNSINLYVDQITDITIVGSINKVDMRQIRHMKNLHKLDLSDSYIIDSGDSISHDMFEGMTSLRWVVLPANIIYVSANTFSDCNRLKYVGLPVSLEYIGTNAFRNCIDLQHIYLPKGLKTIDTCAFVGCSSLKNIRLPESVSTLGNAAFFNCNNLRSAHLSESLTEIGIGCFYNCVNLKEVNLPSSLLKVSANCFYNCKKLKVVSGGYNLLGIGYNAFMNCKSLKTVDIQAQNPPELAFNFATSVNSNCIVFVPIDAAKRYLANNLWGNFKTIRVKSASR